VLDFVDSQLQHVSHEKRQEMTFSEFFERHPLFGGIFDSDLLKEDLKKALGA